MKAFRVNYATYTEVFKLDKISVVNEMIRSNEIRSQCSVHVFTSS